MLVYKAVVLIFICCFGSYTMHRISDEVFTLKDACFVPSVFVHPVYTDQS